MSGLRASSDRASEVGRVIPNAPLGLRPTSDLLPQRKRLFHTPPSWVSSGHTFFITICCTERNTNQLALPEPFRVMTTALEHYLAAEKLWPSLFLAMPDHLHALLAFPSHVRMDAVLRDWKRYVAKQTGIRWQDGFFDHRLRNDESLEEKTAYIRLNPVRAGLIPAGSPWNFVWPDCNTVPAR